ncbi:Replication protein A 32 kDa subunit-B [Lamellibrachia satsuma]|nr:Replication protein A 32 kDa subunit-B [Lamellibrachia satsuma]
MWNNDGGQNAGGFGDQGGGYLNSPGFNTTQNPSQERRRPQRAQSCLPCTVAQIYKANQQDDSFYIEGTEVHQITIIGIVRSVKESATRLDYEIDDMTGPPLEVRQFVDNDEDTPDNERTLAARENTYVRMYGHIRGFGGKTSVVAFRVVPLVDMNELTMHLLEVMHSHMVLTKAQSTGGGDTTQAGMDYTAQGSGYQADYGLTPIQSQVSPC